MKGILKNCTNLSLIDWKEKRTVLQYLQEEKAWNYLNI